LPPYFGPPLCVSPPELEGCDGFEGAVVEGAEAGGVWLDGGCSDVGGAPPQLADSISIQSISIAAIVLFNILALLLCPCR
jgi:hypothetical protein